MFLIYDNINKKYLTNKIINNIITTNEKDIFYVYNNYKQDTKDNRSIFYVLVLIVEDNIWVDIKYLKFNKKDKKQITKAYIKVEFLDK